MPLYVLEIEEGDPLSINAHDDEGAEILARSWLDGEMPPGARVRLRTEDGANVLVEGLGRRDAGVGMRETVGEP